MSGRDLSDKDKRAWAAVSRNVTPLTGRRGTPAGTKRRRDDGSDETFPPLLNKTYAAPQNRQNERAVRRGRQEISASFDLHGHTRESAFQVLPAFLVQEQAKGSQCVIVITGKGKSGEGVLRRAFMNWLDLPEARNLVNGYAPAHAKHGGGGAWYVFLRRRR
ncbi:MAG: Smr/MutS family protein [Pseudomonadota bacterium]